MSASITPNLDERGSRNGPPRNLKSDMLLAATRTFAQVERPDRPTCDQFREAFYLLIGQADPQTRQKVATLLSRCPFCPRPIALYLAMDAPAIAMPILRHSTVLGQMDMGQIVRKRGAVHARVLAARADLPTGIVTQLRALDDADVTAALANNRRVEAPCRAPAPRATADATQAVTAPQAVETKQAVEAPKTAETAASADARALERRLMDALGARRAAPSRAMQGRPAPQPMDADTFRTALDRAALSRDRAAMAKAMRARLNLAHATAMQVLDDHTGNALLVLMKAEGFPAATAHRIVLMALPAVGLSPDAAERVLATWERLEPASCRKALAQWPRAETAPRDETPRAVPQTDAAEGVRRDAAQPVAGRSRIESLRRTG